MIGHRSRQGPFPFNAEVKLEVWDSPNSAGVIIDAVRAAKIALDRGEGGPLLAASSYFMKSPPIQYRDADAIENLEGFIAGEDFNIADLEDYLATSPQANR